jgi:hypothetical protein
VAHREADAAASGASNATIHRRCSRSATSDPLGEGELVPRRQAAVPDGLREQALKRVEPSRDVASIATLASVNPEVEARRGAPCPRRGALQGDRAAQGRYAISKPDEAGAAARVGAAGVVVADAEVQAVVEHGQLDLDDRGMRVLGRIRERLGDDVVDSHLHRLWQPVQRAQLELHRQGRAPGERLERCASPPSERTAG